MKAAFIHQPGPPESIVYDNLPVPEPGPAQVLVKTGAVAVNPIDTYVRGGMIPMDLPSPWIVGCDIAGTVESVGTEVRDLQPGDRVWGSNQGLLGRQGTFAEYAVVDEEWLYPLPEETSFETAAALSLVGITVHLGLFQRGGLRHGETVFVNGGSGGVGSCVVQMARLTGARVLTSAGSEAKAEQCRKLGADAVHLYREGGADEFFKLEAPDGIDLWWETIRDPDFHLAVAQLAENGRMIVMAGRDASPEFPVGPFYVKQCSLHGFVMFKASSADQRTCAEDINRWTADGRLLPNIDRVLGLSETAAAHQLQEDHTIAGTGELSGKLVLRPE